MYGVNGRSFAGVESYEERPVSQLYLMLMIHNESVEREKAAIERARRR